ncbi:hypothetical protein ACLB2K_020124 [Fragaria x ananassa]
MLHKRSAVVMFVSGDGIYLALGSKDGDISVVAVNKMEHELVQTFQYSGGHNREIYHVLDFSGVSSSNFRWGRSLDVAKEIAMAYLGQGIVYLAPKDPIYSFIGEKFHACGVKSYDHDVISWKFIVKPLTAVPKVVYVCYKLHVCRGMEKDLRSTKHGCSGSLFQEDNNRNWNDASQELDICHIADFIICDFPENIAGYGQKLGHRVNAENKGRARILTCSCKPQQYERLAAQ